MINYYYQLPDDARVLGEPVKYLAQYDYHPDDQGLEKRVHTMAWILAERVWLENANGVVLVKDHDKKFIMDRILADEREFAWIKLRAKTL